MLDIDDETDDDLDAELDPRDERAVEVYERLEEELTRDESGHQRYSKRNASTTDCKPLSGK